MTRMPSAIVFHRDYRRKRIATWIGLAVAGGGVFVLMATSGLELNPWIAGVFYAGGIIGILYAGWVVALALGPAANMAECLIIDDEAVRCSLPNSIPHLRREDVRSIRLREAFGYRSIQFEPAIKLHWMLPSVPILKRLGVRYAVWRGYGAIGVNELQIEEDLDEVESALRQLWPEVPRTHG